MTFINREQELKTLEEKWGEKSPQFFIIYGKRRVGKTELIKNFIEDKNSIYFLADKRNEIEILKDLGRIVGDKFKDKILERRGFDNWIEVFEYLNDKASEKIIIAIDEYPYLAENNKAVSSLFQKGWDEHLKENPNIFLILCGSSISMMESETLIHKSPLYGRRTGQILLKPMNFEQSKKFFPKRNFLEFMEIYSISGGMPAYLRELSGEERIREKYKKILDTSSYLYNEVEFILKEELREPKNYLAILRSIAWGKRKLGEIMNETGLEKSLINKYLTVLKNLHLIEREVPITEKNPQKSRQGLYRLADNFLRFWFQFVFPYKSEIEIGNLTEILRTFDERFNSLEAVTYEDVCKEFLPKRDSKVPQFERIGRWWEANEEIDLVGLNNETKEIVFGEAKWSNKKVGVDIYKTLKKKSKEVDWFKKKRKEYFVLFSKSGFTEDMKKLGQQEGLYLIHGDKLLKVRTRKRGRTFNGSDIRRYAEKEGRRELGRLLNEQG